MKVLKLRKAMAVLLALFMCLVTVNIMPVTVSALSASKKDVNDLSLYPSGCLKSMTVVFQADGTYATAYGKIGVQKQSTSMNYLNPYIGSSSAQTSDSWPDTVDREEFVAFGEGAEFLWSDGKEHTVTVEFSDGAVDLNNTQNYYIYLWTRAPSYGIYPDLLLRTLKTDGGKLLDESGNNMIENIVPTEYTVSFDPNGGVSGTTTSSGSLDSEAAQNYVIPETATPSKDGFDFIGWAASSAATTAEYQPSGTINVTSDTTLYAVWKAHSWSEDWEKDETYHWHYCLNGCDEVNGKEDHTFGTWKITQSATAEADGVKKRTCEVCGYVEEGVVKYVPNEDGEDEDLGNISNATNPDENACSADTVLSKQEIIEKFDLTSEELEAIENGYDLNIYLEVVDVTDASETIPEEDKERIDEKIDSVDNMKLGMLIDVSLFKKVGDGEKTKVTETNAPIKITFEMPENLINTSTGTARTYYIIRVHAGDADIINGKFDTATKTFSFETDKFSSYAIAYKDVNIPSYRPSSNTNINTPTSDTSSAEAPETDNDDDFGAFEDASTGAGEYVSEDIIG